MFETFYFIVFLTIIAALFWYTFLANWNDDRLGGPFAIRDEEDRSQDSEKAR